MRKAEFREYLEGHPDIQVLDIDESALVIRNASTGRLYSVALSTLAEVEVRELEEVLSGAREAVSLITITRIVGYYSKTVNWNRSKLGELEDRRRGDYVLEPERPAERREAVAAVRAAG